MADDAIETGQPGPAGKSFWSGKLAALLMLALFASLPLAPLVMTRGRSEILMWRTAAALNRFDAGEQAAGLERLQTLAAMQPEDFQVQQRMADCLVEARQFDQAERVARQLHSRIVSQVKEKQLHPASIRPASSLYARCLVAAGKPARALSVLLKTQEELKKSGALQESDFRYVMDLSNEIAYHAGLAGQQLEMATVLMNEIFSARQSKLPFAGSNSVSTEHQVLICAALVAFQLENPDEVIVRLDQELELVEGAAAEIRRALLPGYYRWMTEAMTGGTIGGNPGESANLAAMRNALSNVQFEMALMLSVRALATGRHASEELRQQAVRDRFRVADLGYDSAELLKLLPDVRQCLEESLDCSMLLDTWGLVLLKKGMLKPALRSLDCACLANDIATRAIDGSLGEHPQEMHDSAMAKRLRDRMSAVLHLHRGQCHQAMGSEILAELDYEQVRKLGFDPAAPDRF